MDETWRPISGYGDCYSVSDAGRVMRTSPRAIPWRGSGLSPSRAKPFVPSLCRSFVNRSGYPQVRIGPSEHQVTVSVHRLVAAAFHPNPGGLRVVNHIDGDKANNRTENLEWTSHGGNARHAYALGLKTANRGEAVGGSKLREADITAIRTDLRPRREIALQYGVDKTLIGLIQRRRIWKHVA